MPSSLRDGLIGAWCPSISGSGGFLLPDLSGFGNHGQFVAFFNNRMRWRVNSGFVSAYQSATNGGAASVPMITAEMRQLTLTAFFTAGGAYYPRLITRQDVTQFGLLVDTNQAQFAISGTMADTGVGGLSTNPKDGAMHFLAGTWDGNTMKLFFDGVLSATIARTTPLAASTTSVFLCNRGSDGIRGLLGDLFDARVYSLCLSDQQVRDLYTGGPGFGLRPERRRKYFVAAAPSGGARRRRLLCRAS